MLRSFEELRRPEIPSRLIADDSGFAALVDHGQYAMPWHWHDCLMFIMPIRGALELKHEGHPAGIWLSHDRFAVVPPDRAHETRAGLNAHSHLALYLTEELLSLFDRDVGSLSEFWRCTLTTTLYPQTPRLRALQALSMRRDGTAYGQTTISRDISSALVLQCIADVIAGDSIASSSARAHGLALVEELKAYIVENMGARLPLDMLEARFGLSRRHMTRIFRLMTGCSIGEFQQRTRLQTACDLLTTTDLPVGEIAFRVGFESGAALAHAMRRADGRSPREVRRQVARSIKK